MTEKEPTKQWISFSLGRETYVHAIDSVREIIQYTPPVPVPGAPHEVEGVLNVRGEVVPVLCGHALLNLPDEAVHDDGWRVIILETPSGLLGLRVDAVREIVAFSEAAIEADTQTAFTSPPGKGGLIKGTYYYGNHHGNHHQQELLIPIDLSGYGETMGTAKAEATPETAPETAPEITPTAAFPASNAPPAVK